MKQLIRSLSKNEADRMRVINTIQRELLDLDYDACYEVVIRNESAGKTLRQLRGHFGHILRQASEMTGEDMDYLHRQMKAKFLVHIYVQEPIGPLQEQWIELLEIYRDTNPDKFVEHAKRISLEWVTKEQMRTYIDDVLNYFNNNGLNISGPDRNRLAA